MNDANTLAGLALRRANVVSEIDEFRSGFKCIEVLKRETDAAKPVFPE
jgi:hypothetical protein